MSQCVITIFPLRSLTQKTHTIVEVSCLIIGKMKSQSSSCFLRFIFILFLFSTFAILFAYPSIKAYMKGSVVVESEYQKENHLQFPAITFCADAVDAWKYKSVIGKSFENNCESLAAENVLECIENNTFSLHEIVTGATSNLLNNASWRVDLMNPLFWSGDFTQPEFGRCYTFQHPTVRNEITVSEAPQFFFTLNSSLSHNIFIHDPQLFMLMVNPSIVPGIETVVDKPGQNDMLTWQYVGTTKHVKKNREDHACSEDPSYEFLACVKQSLAEKIGCAPPGQNISTMPVCNTTEKLFKYHQDFLVLSYMEAREITAYTHCLLPCTFSVSVK